MITAGFVRTMLIIDMIAMALLALIYLRQRKMSWIGYCCWGIVTVAVPFLGPFLLIANRPGEWNPSFSVKNDLARLGGWLSRLLPGSAPKMSRIEQARTRHEKRKPR